MESAENHPSERLMPQPSPALRRWLAHAARPAWAVTDQGLFSISNFAMTLLLARWLGNEHEYGAFTVAMTYFFLLGTLHNSMLIEPMLVFGPKRAPEELPQYFTSILFGHLLLTLPGSLLLAAGGAVCLMLGDRAGGPTMARAMFSVAASAPFILFLWLMRRTCYVRLDPRRAAIAGLAYLLLMVTGLTGLYATQVLSVPTAMAVMGISSLLAGVWMARREGVGAEWPSPEVRRGALADHWEYGRWAIGSGLVAYVPTNVFFLIIPLLAGLAESGALRAMTNLVTPLIQANSAMCVLLLPRLVSSVDTPAFQQTVRRSLLLLAGLPLVYWLVLGAWHGPVMHLAYRGRFSEGSALLWIIGLQPVFTGLCGTYQAALESRRRPDLVFWSGLASAVFCLTGGLWMAVRFGLTGVATSIIVSLAAKWLTCWAFDRRLAANANAIRELGHEPGAFEVMIGVSEASGI